MRLKYLLFIVFFLAVIINLAAEIDINLQSTDTDLVPDQPLLVDVEITGMTEDMRAFAITIEYDTDHFTALPADFLEGTFLSGSGDPTQWEIAGTDGSYTATCAILGYSLGVTGDGTLFSFQLTNLNLPTEGTPISMVGVVLRDVLNNEIIPDNITGLTATIAAPEEGVYLDITLLLEGAWISGTSMRHDLQTADHLPLTSPYNSETLAVFPEVAPRYFVDWIWLELRETADGATLYSCNAFLLDDAGVVSTEGDQLFPFIGAGGNDYYMVVRHRNHLDIMTSIPRTLSDEPFLPTVIDLTDVTNIYGDLGIKELNTGIYGMISGDADRDGQVAPSDRNNHWRLQTNLGGYLSADFDLNSQVQPSDRNEYWRINPNKSSKVPSN